MARGSTIRVTGTPVRLASELAHLLVAARGDRTRRALADEAGVNPSTLADLEHARANPTLAYLEALGNVYGVEFAITTVEPST